MRYGTGIVSALLTVLVVAAVAQEPREERQEPPRKGMMMRGMMGQGMPMPEMMPMMMMMHRQHAMSDSQWEVTEDGLFVLQPDRLLKYDADLSLVKSVDLPEQDMPMMMPMSRRGGGGDDDGPGGPMPKMQMAMRQMMARMHGTLPSKLAVTPSAIFVSRGNHLLKYNRDLEIQRSVELPEAKTTGCPICEQMMGRMRDVPPDAEPGDRGQPPK